MVGQPYNLVVVGGGSAGLVSSYIASMVKARVALVERGKMGGDCLNTGCIPSKTLIRTARYLYDLRRHQEFGVTRLDFNVNFQHVMDRVKKTINRIEPHDSFERYNGLGVECIQGEGIIVDRHTLRVGDRELKTKNIILAQGAEPFIPPIPGLDQIPYLSSDNLWDLKDLPARLVVLGGGPIGCELAQAFSRLGSKVTIVEMLPSILNREDQDVTGFIENRFRQEGISILAGTRAVKVEGSDKDGLLVCEGVQDSGKTDKIPFDKLLIAVGRKARTMGCDWEQLGIRLRKDGTIDVDRYMCANGSNIFAAGDITGPYQFTHTAAHQAYYAAVNALFRPFVRFRANYRVIPWVTYTDPEIARVGLNEREALECGINYDLSVFHLDELDRAITESEAHGFIKVLSQKGSSKGKILGATIVSHNAGDLNTEFIAAMQHGFGLNQIMATIHPYPTMSEANKYTAGIWKRGQIKPWLMNLLAKYHSCRRY